MGKKSNAKKKTREMLKAKEEQEKQKGRLKKKKSKKTLKKEVQKELKVGKKTSKKHKKSKKTAKKAKISINKKKFFSTVFILIMFAILISVGYLIFTKVFRADSIAKYLPADKTILTLEINTNFEHNQLIKTFQLLEKHPNFSKEKLLEKIEEKFSVNYDELAPWLGRKIGFSLLNSNKEENKIQTLYFAEIISQNNFKTFLSSKNVVEDIYLEKNIYKLETPFTFTTINNYIFISDNEQSIKDLINFQNSKEKSIYSTSKYRKIDNNLPLTRLAFLYIDFDQITDAFFQNNAFLSEKGLSTNMLAPLLEILDAEGLILVALDDNFATQSFLSLDRDIVNNLNYLSIDEKYKANLTQYINKDAIVFWGGEDFESKIKRLLEILAGGNRSKLLVFDGLIENYTEKYFGQHLNFENDIINFFGNEYAFGIEEYNDELAYKLIIELASPQEDAIKLQEIANSFATVGAIFEPKIIETELEDGTISRELIAIPEEISKNEKEYADNLIYELIMGDRGWSVFYTTIDDMAIITNSEDAIINTIDLTNNTSGSLHSNKEFINQINPILKNSDEISYFDFNKVLPLVFKDTILPEFVTKISTLVSGKNYFHDGIVTINYLHIN